MARKKIALIGGGQIGGNLALLASQKELGDVVIYDIPQAEGMTKGKALDIMQLRPHDGCDGNLKGTSDSADLIDSDVVCFRPLLATNVVTTSPLNEGSLVTDHIR